LSLLNRLFPPQVLSDRVFEMTTHLVDDSTLEHVAAPQLASQLRQVVVDSIRGHV
jgi:hypothetical protein